MAALLEQLLGFPNCGGAAIRSRGSWQRVPDDQAEREAAQRHAHGEDDRKHDVLARHAPPGSASKVMQSGAAQSAAGTSGRAAATKGRCLLLLLTQRLTQSLAGNGTYRQVLRESQQRNGGASKQNEKTPSQAINMKRRASNALVWHSGNGISCLSLFCPKSARRMTNSFHRVLPAIPSHDLMSYARNLRKPKREGL